MSIRALAFTNLREIFAFAFIAQNTFYLVRWWYRRKHGEEEV